MLSPVQLMCRAWLWDSDFSSKDQSLLAFSARIDEHADLIEIQLPLARQRCIGRCDETR